ncbi:MAG: phosphotransferase, partial [Bacteroidota bacterium]
MSQQTRSGEELPEGPLKAYLASQQLVQNADSEWKVTQFKTGFSNLTYLIEMEDKELVLRRPPQGAVKRGHDMGREYKVLSGLGQGFTKVPKVYAYSEDTDIVGAPFYLMEKVEGIIITDKVAKTMVITPTEFE